MIYIVEDDRSIRDLVLYALHNENYKAEGFENADEFFARVKKRTANASYARHHAAWHKRT